MKCYDCPYRPGRLHVDIELLKPVYCSTQKQTCNSSKTSICQNLKDIFSVYNSLFVPLSFLLWSLREKLVVGAITADPHRKYK